MMAAGVDVLGAGSLASRAERRRVSSRGGGKPACAQRGCFNSTTIMWMGAVPMFSAQCVTGSR
jgi:hypothetical protein